MTRDEARRRAEQALARWEGCRVCQTWKPVRAHALSLADALRALLAAEPEGKACGSISAVRSDATPAQPLPTCANCGSNLIAPAPSPARDEVREAVRRRVCVWCGSALVRDDDATHRWRCQRSIDGKCVARGYWYILDDDTDYAPCSIAPGAGDEVREAAEKLDSLVNRIWSMTPEESEAMGMPTVAKTLRAAKSLLSALAAKPTTQPAGDEVREAAEELQRIDDLLDRRNVLDGLTRIQKIALALRVAEETDPKGEVAARYVCRGGQKGGGR